MAEIKEKLKFHFMNPFQKWRYPKRRRFPWKLLVQLASIILVTAQVRGAGRGVGRVRGERSNWRL